MRLIKLSAFLLLIFFYSYFSYIRFYHIIGDMDLKTPYAQNSVVLENAQGAGSAKYISLGDSLTAGVGSNDSKSTFVYQYASHLSKKFQRVEMVNLGQPGGMTSDLITFQLPVALKDKPDYVTLLIGTNDIHNKVSLKVFRENYLHILNELIKKTDAKITVINIPYLGSSKSVYPPFNIMLNFRTKQFNKIIFNLVTSLSNDRLRLVDLYKETYLPSKEMHGYYSEDLFHPSGEGYIFWGKIISAD